MDVRFLSRESYFGLDNCGTTILRSAVGGLDTFFTYKNKFDGSDTMTYRRDPLIISTGRIPSLTSKLFTEFFLYLSVKNPGNTLKNKKHMSSDKRGVFY